jgi:hypothetical protein
MEEINTYSFKINNDGTLNLNHTNNINDVNCSTVLLSENNDNVNESVNDNDNESDNEKQHCIFSDCPNYSKEDKEDKFKNYQSQQKLIKDHGRALDIIFSAYIPGYVPRYSSYSYKGSRIDNLAYPDVMDDDIKKIKHNTNK